MKDVVEHKILPFDSPQGRVPGHAIIAYRPWPTSTMPRNVVFWTFDSDAECPIEIVVDVSYMTKFLKRSLQSHTVKAVIMEDGTRLEATTRSVAFSCNEAYKAAPLLCRGVFKVLGLCNGITLLEVAGVSDWAYGKRRPEDDALILDPWARDNAKYAADLAARNAA